MLSYEGNDMIQVLISVGNCEGSVEVHGGSRPSGILLTPERMACPPLYDRERDPSSTGGTFRLCYRRQVAFPPEHRQCGG